jgi:hypothetical protein
MNKFKWTNGTILEKSMRSKMLDKQTFIVSSNKIDKFNDLINAREMMPSNKINPFLINNNYLKDLDVQTKFLIPQNSQY